ncbi:hypothetical protein CHS0354_002378 [Potamilus streckersoni]|uniref:Uncharacterized protein n=1 Tax=Potamilus streckersoni TaxID=2493646 RepID=A0AAE0VZV4_9BIVA|nr:hypothetical protein CHS0354_002378 [Potamilus streckersoni]
MSAPAHGMSQSESETDEKKEKQDSSQIKGKSDENELENFIKEKQRKCNTYAPKKDGNCQCGYNKEWHEKVDDHTQQFPYTSFGEIKFKENGKRYSPYIRVNPKTDVKFLWTKMKEHWELNRPKLLISVTGGAKIRNLSQKHQLNFKKSLMNAATIKGAWIITGGTKTGVMKLVGEAVTDPILTNGTTDTNIVALGIATWGCLANRENFEGDNQGLWPAKNNSADLVNRKETGDEPEVPLDPNHTHFILVDDGSIKKYGVERSLRDNLEQELYKHCENMAVVKIVVGGGNNTMNSIKKSVSNNVPVLVLQGSGGAADFIAFGYHLSKCKDNEEESNFPNDFEEKLKNKAKFVLGWKPEDKIEEKLRDILNYRKMINVFNLNEADTKDINKAILCALMKAKNSNASLHLELALAWNASEIARDEILDHEEGKKICLEDYMCKALMQDRADFVQLFLDQGVSFTKFGTKERLYQLYSEHPPTDFYYRQIEKFRTKKKRNISGYCICCRKQENDGNVNGNNKELAMLASVGKFIADLLRDESMNTFTEHEFNMEDKKSEQENHNKRDQAEGNCHCLWHCWAKNNSKSDMILTSKCDFKHPEKHFFLWAILFNKKEVAKLLWKMTKNQIAGALVACALLKRLAVKAADDEELELSVNIQEHSQKYEDLATYVLGECYRQNKDLAHKLLVRELKMYGGTTLFTLADANELMKFMGHTCCQTKLNLIWKGRMAQDTSSLRIFMAIIIPIIMLRIKFRNVNKVEEMVAKNKVKPVIEPSKSETSQNKDIFSSVGINTIPSENQIGIISAIYFFYRTPITVFIIHNIFYLMFLAIFTYFVLTDLYPGKPSVLEYITWATTGTMLIEEIRQVVTRDEHSVMFKICSWLRGMWNRFDLLMLIFFLASVILRFVLNEDQFSWTRITYSIALAMYYLRFMQVFFAEKHIGPKVIMIKNMIVDLLFFMVIFVIFLLSFGIVYQANLFPNSVPSWYLLKSVIYMPYWQLYGELFLDEMESKHNDGCVNNETVWRATDGQGRCPADNVLVPLLGAIYMILTNILLINLLIAMFSYTFQKVQEQSENVWRFYRFSLVQEYYDRPLFCPPFIIIIHVIRVIKYVFQKNDWLECSPILLIIQFVKFVHSKCICDASEPDNEFNLELSEEDNDRLTLFENSALEYLNSSQGLELETVDKKVTTAHESHMVHTDVKDDTGNEMQIHKNELRNEVQTQLNGNEVAQMMQMLQQILRNQERSMHTSHLEISDISPSTDA